MEMYQNIRAQKQSISGVIIAAVCIIIYLFALAQAVVRLYLSVEQRKYTADREFANITDIALSAGNQGFMDDRFVAVMENELKSSRSLEALIISGPEGEYAFEKQRGRAITWVNNSPRFINRFSFSSANHYNTLPINNLRNVNIRAVAGAFDYADFTKILKETLLLILIGFALAFFTLLLQLLINGKQEEIYISSYAPAPVPERTPVYTPPAAPFATATVESSAAPFATATVESSAAPFATAAAEPAAEPAAAEEEVFDWPIEDTVLEEEKEPPQFTEKERKEESGPKGLYSPRSNIGWEEYTNDRLDSELHRCASTEKDLTFLLIDFTDDISNPVYKQAAEEAVTFFTTRDLLFEYGAQGIAAIVPGVDLETCLVKAQKYHQRIKDKLSHKAYIGLSSRSGRLLNAGRILIETKEALKKAFEDSVTSIIAFKSDPEKYREFIKNRA